MAAMHVAVIANHLPAIRILQRFGFSMAELQTTPISSPLNLLKPGERGINPFWVSLLLRRYEIMEHIMDNNFPIHTSLQATLIVVDGDLVNFNCYVLLCRDARALRAFLSLEESRIPVLYAINALRNIPAAEQADGIRQLLVDHNRIFYPPKRIRFSDWQNLIEMYFITGELSADDVRRLLSVGDDGIHGREYHVRALLLQTLLSACTNTFELPVVTDPERAQIVQFFDVLSTLGVDFKGMTNVQYRDHLVPVLRACESTDIHFQAQVSVGDIASQMMDVSDRCVECHGACHIRTRESDISQLPTKPMVYDNF